MHMDPAYLFVLLYILTLAAFILLVVSTGFGIAAGIDLYYQVLDLYQGICDAYRKISNTKFDFSFTEKEGC